MSDLIDTTEMYLRTIYELGEEGVTPLRARIAERLKQSGPTVSQTVARMERDGLVTLHEDRHLVLTARGRDLATRVMRRHRLAERLLTDVIGLEWELVHDEACRWEHVISTDVERRLVDILGQPVSSPYGNPIPALEELGAPAAPEDFLDGAELLSARLLIGGTQEVTIVRMSEALQADLEALRLIGEAGVRPGIPLTASLAGPHLILEADQRCVLPTGAADLIFVAVD